MDEFIAPWHPHREPLRTTLARTVGIAVLVGVIVAVGHRRTGVFAAVAILALWFTLGGHWVEVFFLNWLRFRLPHSSFAQAAARLLVWFVGGAILTVGMRLTAPLVEATTVRFPVWIGGLAFIGIELLIHVVFRIRGRPSFWSGDG